MKKTTFLNRNIARSFSFGIGGILFFLLLAFGFFLENRIGSYFDRINADYLYSVTEFYSEKTSKIIDEEFHTCQALVSSLEGYYLTPPRTAETSLTIFLKTH